MGTQTGRNQKARNLKDLEALRLELQAETDSKKENITRKKLGQFATPSLLAREIVDYALQNQKSSSLRFLEPALGSGSFYSALLAGLADSKRSLSCAVGVELDPDFLSLSQKLWTAYGLQMIGGDFTRLARNDIHANLLISNPPYVRHHYIRKEDKEFLANRVSQETGLHLSGLAGLYCYFILLAHKYLEQGALSAWLVPSEFMDVNYGGALKEYLLDRVKLLRIHRYDPRDTLFSDALVSSCVVWFKNELAGENHQVEFSFGGSHQKPRAAEQIPLAYLKNERKWTRFPRTGGVSAGTTVPKGERLGDYFTVKRGLVTGDNAFFIMTREQTRNLDPSYFLPVLPSPRKLKVNEVFSDGNGYPALDEQYFLLNCDMPEREIAAKHPELWRYLKTGEQTTALKYICKNRKIWYLQERRKPTPFLCSYMGRGGKNNPLPFRFILNHSDAVVTNTYLMLYPKKELARLIRENPESLEQIWSALGAITADELRSEGRVYGGGLRKIEPNELARVRCHVLSEKLRDFGFRTETDTRKSNHQREFAF